MSKKPLMIDKKAFSSTIPFFSKFLQLIQVEMTLPSTLIRRYIAQPSLFRQFLETNLIAHDSSYLRQSHLPSVPPRRCIDTIPVVGARSFLRQTPYYIFPPGYGEPSNVHGGTWRSY